MNILNNILYYFIVKPLSLLPMRILYMVSDFFYVMIYYVVPYRKKVVYNNLRKSFPDYTDPQIKAVSKQYYKHLCDIIIETIKAFSLGKEELLNRFVCTSPDVIKQLNKSEKSIILITGHYNNWEWGGLAFPLHFTHKGYGIYTELSSNFWDIKVKAMRQHINLSMIPMKDTLKCFRNNQTEKKVVAFIADQTPVSVDKCYWIKFLHQDTPVHKGAARFAKMFDCVVVYGDIQKVKRGRYQVSYRVLCDNTKDIAEDDITKLHVKILEQKIIDKPQYWLWTHKRWKRAPPPGTIIND